MNNTTETKVSIVCYLDIPYEFAEMIDVYKKESLTLEQLFIIYRNLKQVKVRATLVEKGRENSVTIEAI
jgi:hypothetical protein